MIRNTLRVFPAHAGDATIGTWVWVYHAPPSGSPTCWDGKKHYGDAALVKWIDFYQPDLVFTGHIHQAPFTSDDRIWISGYDLFQKDVTDVNALLTAHGIDHTYAPQSSALHSWMGDWLPQAVSGLYHL